LNSHKGKKAYSLDIKETKSNSRKVFTKPFLMEDCFRLLKLLLEIYMGKSVTKFTLCMGEEENY